MAVCATASRGALWRNLTVASRRTPKLRNRLALADHCLEVLAFPNGLPAAAPHRRRLLRSGRHDGSRPSLRQGDRDADGRYGSRPRHVLCASCTSRTLPGDDVLRHLARVLPAGLRGRDRLGRLGGEEFLVVLPGATLDQAAQIAERMRDGIAATPLITAAGELRFTISIGVAEWRSPADSVAALLERADAALYRAKDSGRNAVKLDDNDQPAPRRHEFR